MRLVESDDSYPRVVAILNDQWRVIECRDGMRWILQYRNRAKSVAKHTWRGRSYCRTRAERCRVIPTAMVLNFADLARTRVWEFDDKDTFEPVGDVADRVVDKLSRGRS
jgi:hypothetical protein